MRFAESHSERGSALLASATIAGALLLAYCGSFSGPFVFDDIPSIPQNPSIRRWELALSPPPGGLTVSGRPVLNLSLAANFASGGGAVWGYHVFNFVIHVAAALVLFGCVRRTLLGWLSPSASLRAGAATALIWALHPLQTESVTYVVQRAESLMGLCYLLTLYGFIRGATSGEKGGERLWYGVSIVGCLLGAGAKEVIVSAPLMVLLYDRVFLAGSFREAWRQRAIVYGGLGLSWVVLAWLVYANGSRGGTVQLGSAVHSNWIYWTTQGPAILRYLRLALWPSGQVIDYGFETVWARHPLAALPFNVAAVLLFAGAIVLFLRRPRLGFLGIWFFAILAPTSVIPGLRQTIVEHRMYLALAPLCVLAAVGLDRVCERSRPWVWIAALALVASALGVITAQRNRCYRSALALWADAVTKRPDDIFARGNLGTELMVEGRLPEAISQYRAALKIEPAYVDARVNIGRCLEKLGRPAEAWTEYQQALRIRPNNPDVHSCLGVFLAERGHAAEAEKELKRATTIKPTDAEFHNNYGAVLSSERRMAEAETEFRTAVALRADYVDAEYNLGSTLRREGRPGDALSPLRDTLRIEPRHGAAHYELGMALHTLGRSAEALGEFGQAVRLAPGFPEGHNNLGSALAEIGRMTEAQTQFEEAVKLNPNYAEAHHNLGTLLRDQGHFPQAIQELRIAARLSPANPTIRKDLEDALAYLTPR